MSEAAEAPKRALEDTNDTVDDGKKQKISFNMGAKKAPVCVLLNRFPYILPLF